MSTSPWWKIQAKTRRAELSIYGDIGESWWGESVTAKDCCKEIAAIAADTIDVRINSYGGSVADGLAIFNSLKRHPAAIVTHNDGVAMSIASLIFMAGTERHSAENALFMVHAPWGMAAGNAADMRDMADILDKYAEGMISAYRASRLTDDQIRALLTDGQDHFYTAAEAQADGFVTHVTEALPIAAQYAMNRFTKRARFMTTESQTEAPNIAAIEAAAEARALERIKARNEEFDRQFGIVAKKMPSLASTIAALRDDPSISIETASTRILAKMAEGCEPLMAHRIEGPSAQWGRNAHATEFRAAAVDHLLARSGIQIKDMHPAARDLRKMGTVEIAERILSMHGKPTRDMSRGELIRAALGTSDFPELLSSVANKAMLVGFAEAPSTHKVWTGSREVPDFKEQTLVALSETPPLELVLEHAEFHRGHLLDTAEKASVKTYGKILQISRQSLVNDDLSAFSTLPQAFGRSASRLEADLVYSKLVSNPTLSDGVALFHSTHGNLAETGAALSVASLSEARAAMRRQRGLAGESWLDLVPRYLVVPPEMESLGEVLLTSLIDPALLNDGKSPGWIRQLILVCDPRLSGNVWYLLADPAQHEGVVRLYLQGQTEPYLEEIHTFNVDAVSIKVRHDFGVMVVDHRGLFMNPGA